MCFSTNCIAFLATRDSYQPADGWRMADGDGGLADTRRTVLYLPVLFIMDRNVCITYVGTCTTMYDTTRVRTYT